MADTKISQLPAVVALTGTELVPVVQGGVNKTATAAALTGADGADGADGRTTLSGIGAPSAGTGEDGDFYIDTSASDLYGPKASGAWGSPTSLIGPAGETGPQGPQGETGPAGPTGPAGADGADASYSNATPQALGTAAAGVAEEASRADHVHDLPAVVSTSAPGLAPATSFAALDYAASVALDFSALDGQVRTITLTGDLELTTSNLATGRRTVIRLLPGASERTLTFPTDWVFVCAKPATLAASKSAVVSLTAFGTANADVIAAYAVQP